eukprot:NODE_2642_length_492_cov_177.031603_g2102_i0.p2 GENE.NODE_2642_length_492_cov_177.031603_g2102_i0~~NODE_2642_length_492_cov_177.031603_g2102_i0.p2  ORF type:complete len:78 (+),score=19.27 NODE_2642_length_492_cov_177.031603_g2102_i0:124-357(+)
MNAEEKRAKDQACKDADLAKKGVGGGEVVQPKDQAVVQEEKAFAAKEAEKAACDYAALEALEKEAKAAQAAHPAPAE